tara:strand:+ start:150 stop:545 length:396 start_codon:yes stop_codon:yes gene_type:complete
VFKTNALSGLEDFNTGTIYTYKIALYTAAATLNADTLAYTVDGEITGTGYTAGGEVLTPTVPASSSGTAYVTFADVTWSPAQFTASGALIYNSTTGAAVAVLNFGSDKTATLTFEVQFPTATATTAIIRLS